MLRPFLVAIISIGIYFACYGIVGQTPDFYHGSCVVAAILIGVTIEAWLNFQAWANMTLLAERLGLQVQVTGASGIFKKKKLTVEGRYRSRNVRFFVYQTPKRRINRFAQIRGLLNGIGFLLNDHGILIFLGMDSKKAVWSAVGATMAGHREFILEAEARPTRPGPAVNPESIIPGLEEVVTKDPAFDQAVLVRSNDLICAKEMLTAKIRAQFLDQSEAWRPFNEKKRSTLVIISGGKARYAVCSPTNFLSKARTEHIAAKLDFVCDLAEKVENRRA